MPNRDHLRRSVAARRSSGRFGRALRVLGPGIITGAADDDPAGIITSSQAGARFRYDLTWTALLQFPLLSAVQLMVARIGILTGRDFTRVLGEHYPRWMLWAACTLLFMANTFTAGADLAGVAAGIRLLTGFQARWTIAPLAVTLTLVVVFGAYRQIARFMKWLTLALLAYV